MTEKLSQEQKMRAYCVKHGHADYFTMFWGYVHCGRCGEQIGDKLGGVFPAAENMASPQCKTKPCPTCDPIVKKLNKMDKTIFERLKKHPSWDTEKVLKGVAVRG